MNPVYYDRLCENVISIIIIIIIIIIITMSKVRKRTGTFDIQNWHGGLDLETEHSKVGPNFSHIVSIRLRPPVTKQGELTPFSLKQLFGHFLTPAVSVSMLVQFRPRHSWGKGREKLANRYS